MFLLKGFLFLAAIWLQHQQAYGQTMKFKLSGSVEAIQQVHPFSCALAVAESILKYYGMTSAQLSQLGTAPSSQQNAQYRLAHEMKTDPNSGTLPGPWQKTMNEMIAKHNLAGGKQYSITEFHEQGFANTFYHLVRASLDKNVPVALFFQGNVPDYIDENSDAPIVRTKHVILIYGLDYVKENGKRTKIIYRYMDPWTASLGSFTELDLPRIVIQKAPDTLGYLLSYIPPATDYTSNKFDPDVMELGRFLENLRI